jgi:hypothetical protein
MEAIADIIEYAIHNQILGDVTIHSDARQLSRVLGIQKQALAKAEQSE